MRYLKKYGFKNYIISTHYLPDVIKEYFNMKKIDYEEVHSVDGNIISKLVCLIYLLE